MYTCTRACFTLLLVTRPLVTSLRSPEALSEARLPELADVFRMCSDSKDIPEVRDLAVSTLLATWQEEAQKALEPWVPFTDAAGLPCFHNWVTGEFTSSTLHLSIPYGST
ncbi:unnamed protein product [Prorocentrum cordatum]|uniref:Selenoprotein O n=1 Tax=Prorocentrum cordatum TaxID=2364126 RepID=A0ABN9V6W3_9DINO|nr:unnamed protein product [Polarella glacialis]